MSKCYNSYNTCPFSMVWHMYPMKVYYISYGFFIFITYMATRGQNVKNYIFVVSAGFYQNGSLESNDFWYVPLLWRMATLPIDIHRCSITGAKMSKFIKSVQHIDSKLGEH